MYPPVAAGAFTHLCDLAAEDVHRRLNRRFCNAALVSSAVVGRAGSGALLAARRG